MVRDASTFRLPAHRGPTKTSRANILGSSPAWSNRGVRSFFGSYDGFDPPFTTVNVGLIQG